MHTSAFFISLLTALLFAAYGILSRVLSVKSKNPLAFSAVFGFLATCFSLPLLFLEPWQFRGVTPFIIFVTALATICYGLFETTEFFARKYLEASRSTVIFQLAPLIASFGAILLLGEPLTGRKLAAIVLIVGGNLIALYRQGGAVSFYGLLFALGAAFGLGFGYIADKVAFVHFPLGLYILITYFFPALYIFFFLIRRQPFLLIKEEISDARWRLPLLALVGVAGYYTLLRAFRLADVSFVTPIAFSSTILTALGGIIILYERGNIMQKILGATFVFLGVILLK